MFLVKFNFYVTTFVAIKFPLLPKANKTQKIKKNTKKLNFFVPLPPVQLTHH